MEIDDDFAPFLSSTDNELTDLNTDFNTERPGGQSQSTFRSKLKQGSQLSQKVMQGGNNIS